MRIEPYAGLSNRRRDFAACGGHGNETMENFCNIPCDGDFTKCVELRNPLTQAISDTLPECRSVGRALSAVVQASYSREHFV